LLLVTAAVGASVAALVQPHRLAAASTADASDAQPPVLVFEQGGLRYEYHLPTGGECLFDAARDPRGLVNLLRDHEETAARCRAALVKLHGVSKLSDLGARYADTVRRLRSLGYL